MLADFVVATYMQSTMRRTMKLESCAPGNEMTPPGPGEHAHLLYLHVPFCEEICPFCSFNRVKFDGSIARAYFESLRTEIRMYADLGYRFDALYAGGGTPVIEPSELASTLKLARELWQIERISTEVNPNHLSDDMLDIMTDLGITRLSVGIQTFDDAMLKIIGRYERYGSGRENVDRLVKARGRFNTLNVDMIFNYPEQTEEMLRNDLETVLSVEADQITFYPLMSPKATREHASREYRSRELNAYRLIRGRLAEDYEPSSAWCFSRRGSSAETRDTLVDEYIVDHEDYAGLGSGSFGYMRGSLYSNTFDIRRYIRTLNDGTLPIVARKDFSRDEQIRYDFLMKLFAGSLSLDYFDRKYGKAAAGRLWKELFYFRAVGALRVEDGDVTLTEKGAYLWVVLMREFFTGVNLFREHCMSEISSATAVATGTGQD